MLRRAIVAALATSSLFAIVAPLGCGANAEGPPLVGTDVDVGAPRTADAACVPSTPPPPMGPTTLPSCCTAGAAHCVQSSDVPASLAKQLAACAGGYCVPDPFIEDPTLVPAACTAFNGTPGACISVCVPQVQQYLSLLQQGTCAADERCAPCINPLDNSDTGACEVGKPCAGPSDAGPGADGGVCPYTGPPKIDPTTFAQCTPACAGSHCVPASLVPAAEQSQLVQCPSGGPDAGGDGGLDGYCVPDSFIASGGDGLPPTCTSVAGAEGRCLSTCIPLVASETSVLPQATCASDERCAPCFNPTASDPTAPTGACSVACDEPAQPPTILSCPYTGPAIIDPTTFPACSPACGGAHCLPTALVPASQQSQLATCPGGFCAPDSLIASGGQAVPATCTSVAGAEGRCLSTCLPLVASEANVLPQATCASDERCAPCYDPTAANPSAPTGACSIACDKPTQPPVVLTCPWTGPNVVDPTLFPACSPACGGAHCVPSSLVPASQQSQLATCPGGFCTPDSITATDDHYLPPTCAPFADPASEGRCQSECLPSVQQQSSELVQDVCPGGDLCAPCTDPFKGTSTGACTLACDSPKKPPFTFPLCCSYQGQSQGTCVPKTLVPSSEQSNLQQDVCPTNAASYLCVPDEYLPNATVPVDTCTAGLLGKGTCVSKCVSISLGIVLSQGTCPANHDCVPCSLAPAGTPGC
jgi:hypothetical protein